MELTKQCRGCMESKAASEFYKHPRMSDGRLNYCRECVKKRVKKRYETEREARSDYERRRYKTPRRKATVADYRRRYKARCPEKVKAREKVSTALRSGKLMRQPCVHCGSQKSQAHHTDYAKPLDVTWCCFRCHRERGHGQVVVSTAR